MEIRSLISGALLLFGLESMARFFNIGVSGIPSSPVVTLALGIASILFAYYLLRM